VCEHRGPREESVINKRRGGTNKKSDEFRDKESVFQSGKALYLEGEKCVGREAKWFGRLKNVGRAKSKGKLKGGRGDSRYTRVGEAKRT